VREINAFALPGGPMYINRGMIQAAAAEGEVAGVDGSRNRAGNGANLEGLLFGRAGGPVSQNHVAELVRHLLAHSWSSACTDSRIPPFLIRPSYRFA
jgi:hypothetical protein